MTHFYDYSQMIELVPGLNSVSTLKKGNVNSPLHTDYLNNKMKSTELRHTGATLAKLAGTSIEAISEALTHSDTATTKTYINTSNIVPMAVGEIAFRNLKK